MYKQIKTDKEFLTDTGAIRHPIATLSDEAGGKCQICEDDHCYVPFLGSDERPYTTTCHLFSELVEFLGTLPKLEVRDCEFFERIWGDECVELEEVYY